MTTLDRLVTPFSWDATASQIVDGLDLSGRRIIVTGASSGIGFEMAGALASAGAEVTVTVRQNGPETVSALSATTGVQVSWRALDLTDLGSIDAFVRGWDGPLDALINNAGVMGVPETRTARGWELHFATNHLGPFRLTTGLLPALMASGSARVVSLTSAGHLRSRVVFDDVHFRFRPYSAGAAYAQSKTANSLFAVGADERWQREGVRVNAVHPGTIKTALYRHVGDIDLSAFALKTAEQGAATAVLAAVHPLLDGVGGRFLAHNHEAAVVDHTPPDLEGVAPFAIDRANADRLWVMSEELLAPQSMGDAGW